MLRKINKWIFVIAGIFMFGALFFVSQKSLMQKQETKAVKTDDSLPEGNWSASFHPYLKDDYINSPVFVTSVVNKDAAVASFEVFNNSKKDVKALRVKWMIYADENRQKVLKEGKSSFIRFFDRLSAGKSGKIKHSVISLRGFYQSFIENGRLDKDFQVEIMIDEVRFSDGTFWKSDDGKPSFVNAKFERPSNFEKFSKILTPCAMQQCKAGNGGEVKPGPSVTYTCGSSTFRETCVNSADNYSCSNVACDRPPGSGGDIDFEMIQP